MQMQCALSIIEIICYSYSTINYNNMLENQHLLEKSIGPPQQQRTNNT